MPIFTSNSLEVLLEQLIKEIFKKKRTVLSLPPIAVASYGMQRWLKLRLAQHNIPLGLKIDTLDRSLGVKVSSKYDLFVALYRALQQLRDPMYSPVQQFVQTRNKLIHLAKILSRNFYLYGIYGEPLEGWQRELYLALQKPPYGLKFWSHISFPQKEIHLFGFSFLPPLFLEKLPSATGYFLSPCQEFWSSTVEVNPLLLSLGKLGREMAKQLDGKSVETLFHIPQEEFTLLQALKLDLLFNKVEGRLENFTDHSIELHETFNCRQEIEGVYLKLMELAGPDFDPSEVLVVAKDIAPYIPYIQACFEKEDSLFDPILFDQPKGDGNRAFLYLQQLVEFGRSRLEKHLYLALEPRDKVKEWIDEGEILWGYDQAHRNQLLEKGGCRERYGSTDGRGTWKYGFEKLLSGLLTEESPKIKEAEELGFWIASFERMYRDLTLLLEGERTAKEWALALRTFIDSHVVGKEEEKEALKLSLNQIVPSFDLPIPLPFELIYERFCDILNQKENVLGDRRLHAVTFSSLFPNRALPKRYLFFLGAQTGDFPARVEENSLNLLVGKNFFPTAKQEDRYAFLEALLSAQKFLWISYQKEKGPSSVVTELFDYLDAEFTVEGKKPSVARFYRHPEEKGPAQRAPFLQTLPKREVELEVELKDLFRFGRDPLHAFYRKGLSLQLKDAEIGVDESVEDFVLDDLQKYGLGALLKGGKGVQAYRQVALPIHAFQKIAHREVSHWEERLKKYGASKTLLFQRGAKAAKPDAQLEIWPALVAGSSVLVGELDGVTPEGLLVDEKNTDPKTVYKVWPKLLILGAIGYPTTLLYWKLGKEKAVALRDPETQLKKFVEYYGEAQRRPSPACPDLVRTLLEKNYGEAKKKFAEERKSHYWNYCPPQLTEEEYAYWQAFLKEIYV